jgi:hypothetical protein
MSRKYFLFLSVLLCLFLAGCGGHDGNSIVENTSEFWRVEIETAEVVTGLAGSQSQLQYGGTIIEIPLGQMPRDGYLFLILDMTVEKINAGRSSFSWRDTFITDNNGNKWQRHENDTFLDSFGFARLRGSDIVMGLNEGHVCYEIPVQAARGNLWFVHESDDGFIKIEINILNRREIR